MKGLKSLIFCLIVFLGVNSYAKAAPLSQPSDPVLYVTQSGTGDCTSWGNACDLQTALSSANSGDQVWVAAGIYKPTTTDPYLRDATFILKSGVAIYGGFPASGGTWMQRNWESNSTTLSGEIGDSGIDDNSYHVVTGSNVDATAVLDGFTITGGNANGTTSHYYGGGMYNWINSSPTLTNLNFSTNSASDSGGGMYNYSSSNPTIVNATFSGNSAYAGGGMVNNSSSPMLTNVTFSVNSASEGGGMVNQSSSNPTLANLTFSNNTASIYGGGILNLDYSSPILNNVTFSGNSAINGGGIYNLYYSNPTLTNVTFSTNPANSGGGIYNDSSSPLLTNVTFSSNTASNDGGGMSNNNHSNPILNNVTFYGNSAINGGGMANWNSNSTLTNAIVWGNTPTTDQIHIDQNSSSMITYSDIQTWTSGGTGNIGSDPFLAPLANNGGFTQTHALAAGSPAINKADPSSCPATDQRGHHRLTDDNGDGVPDCDMGAYEFDFSRLYLPLIVK